MPVTVTARQRNGKHFFVFPEVAKNPIYVGTQTEYGAYLRVDPGAGGATLAQQEEADLASYNRPDSTMRMYNRGDMADPYCFWNSFDGLGWR